MLRLVSRDDSYWLERLGRYGQYSCRIHKRIGGPASRRSVALPDVYRMDHSKHQVQLKFTFSLRARLPQIVTAMISNVCVGRSQKVHRRLRLYHDNSASSSQQSDPPTNVRPELRS